MSRLFLYKELRLPLEKEKSQEREKRIAPFIKKIGAGSILLCRVGISYLAKALRSSTGEPSLDEFTKAVEKKDQFEKKLEDLKNQGQMVMPVRKFIKSFFADPKKTKQLNAFDCQYYKVFYHYHYYLVLEKFFDYV
ncbi:MAG: hypothetical protein JW991_05385 [Candidatus Pacebacteria bacterium]|nr:hypothetical protein [Candidatus Paceibacterota bacterium]